MSVGLPVGAVIRIPKGTTVEAGGDRPAKTRRERIAVIDYVGGISDDVCFKANGKDHWVARADVELVTRTDHSLIQQKRDRGRHPIAGWNWPIWGYRYTCACGEYMGEDDARAARAAHADHLEGLR